MSIVISGGIDKQYSFVAGSDIRKENLTSGAKYRIQATHPSVNASFNDTLSFVLASNSSSTTIVRVCNNYVCKKSYAGNDIT